MGRWAQALGTGSLLSRRSHALQVGPQNVGLGPLTADLYYGMGLGGSNGWIAANPQLLGYNGVVSYLPAKRVAVVVFTTQGPRGKPSSAYASAIYDGIGRLLAPKQPPSSARLPAPSLLNRARSNALPLRTSNEPPKLMALGARRSMIRGW